MLKYLSPIISSLSIFLFSAVAMSQPSLARPDLTTPIDMSLLHDTASGYHFVTQRFSVAAPALAADDDNAKYAKPRHYQVWLGIPNSLQSNQSHTSTSVVYMLDGNGVIDDLDSSQLAALTQASGQSTPPVLVFIGYQTPYRFDVAARAYDYTPPLLSGLPSSALMDNQNTAAGVDNTNNPFIQAFKERNRERLNGGAEVFYQHLQTKIKPWVNEQLGYAPDKQTLWGHSYGGLFVLYTLFHHPESFNRYYSVDPSLWWQDGEIIKQYKIEKQKLSALDTMPYVRMTFSSSAVRQANSSTKEDFGKLLCSDWQQINSHKQSRLVDSTKNNANCSYQLYQQSHGQLFNTGMQDMLSDF